jgi:hypothetical protein
MGQTQVGEVAQNEAPDIQLVKYGMLGLDVKQPTQVNDGSVVARRGNTVYDLEHLSRTLHPDTLLAIVEGHRGNFNPTNEPGVYTVVDEVVSNTGYQRAGDLMDIVIH